jgi:septum site-determining protein MinC
MKNSCVIKSFPNGINLILKGDVAFAELLEEIAAKFEKSRPFFGNASVALSFEGRELSEEEENQIVEVIHKNSDIDVVCIMAKDPKTDLAFVKALQKVAKQIPDGDEGYFFKGSLVNGNEIDTEQSIVILGDVEEGCIVKSSGSIIVLGGLYGKAYAGKDGNTHSFVAALEMSPVKVKVGEFKYINNKKKLAFGAKPKAQIAFVQDNKIVFDKFTKDILASL